MKEGLETSRMKIKIPFLEITVYRNYRYCSSNCFHRYIGIYRAIVKAVVKAVKKAVFSKSGKKR